MKDVKMKKLYILSGGTDGYYSSQFTFYKERAEQELENDCESYPADDCLDSINVPEWMTYEDLGIHYPLECDDECEEGGGL